MKNETGKSDKAALLRKKAEKCLLEQQNEEPVPITEADAHRLLYELEVHQIELEMQNEELEAAKAKAEINAEKYTNLYDFAPCGYFTLCRNGNIHELNIHGAQMLGADRINLINSSFDSFVVSESKSVFKDFLNQVFQSNTLKSIELQLIGKENSPVYIQLQGIASDSIEHCFLTAVNISDRIVAETALIKEKENVEKNEKELKKVQHIANLGSWYLDLATDQVVWSEELYRMYGFDPNLPVPPYSEHMKLFTKESWEILSTSLKRTTETGEPYELELKTIKKDGSNGWIWATGEAIRDAQGKITGLWGAAQDISQRKRNEEKIRESNELNQSLLRTIPFGISIVDLEGNILFMSEKLKTEYGKDSIGKKCWEIYRDDKKQPADCPLLSDHFKKDDCIYETSEVFGGKTFQVNHTHMVFKGQNAVLGIFQDITEKKKYEIDLVNAKEHAEESDRLKSAFLANMSHEIRTPMNGILGFASLLKEPDLTGEEKENYIRIIEKSGLRMLNIINDIVNISKIEAGLMKISNQSVNLNEVLEYIYTFFKPEMDSIGRQLFYDNTYAGEEAILYTDGEKLYAIFTNLVKNAIKYSQSGPIELGFVRKDGVFEFYVRDNGVGIPKNRQKAIFERFMQENNPNKKIIEGTGLGLSISASYVEMMGGTIWVKSKEGKGSTFYFTIPIKKEAIT